MEPYTAEGMARKDAQEKENQLLIEDNSSPQEPMQTTPLSSSPGTSMTVVIPSNNQINYELVGIVVHSGQANAGHYYSFIKDRRSVHKHPTISVWIRSVLHIELLWVYWVKIGKGLGKRVDTDTK